MSGDIFDDCYDLGNGCCYQHLVGAIRHRSASIRNNYLVQNGNSAGAEKP